MSYDSDAKNQICPNEFLQGAKDILPMLIGTAPFGLIFGVLCAENGLSFFGGQSFSLFVFAGSAQFVGVNLFGQNIGLLTIFVTTFILNLRHALYGASLGTRLTGVNKKQRMAMAFFLTDESFSVVGRYSIVQARYYWGAALSMYLNWQFWTLSGLIFAKYFSSLDGLEFSFLMVPAFIVILWPQLREIIPIICAAVSALASISLLHLPNQLGLIIACIVGISVALSAEILLSLQKRKSKK